MRVLARHPERLQLYSLPTPNGVKVTVMLEELLAAGHEVALVLTQPDRPAGRGKQLVDAGGAPVARAGVAVTVGVGGGAGSLSGATTRGTDATGRARHAEAKKHEGHEKH